MKILTDFLFDLYGLPNWKLGTCFIGFFVITGLTGLVIFRKLVYLKMRLSSETNEGVNFFAQTVGVLYGLLMGMVAVSCWSSFEDLDNLISEEVSLIGSFYRITSGLESPYRPAIQEKTLAYLHDIFTLEWPRYAEGRKENEIPREFNELRKLLFKVNPSSDNQKMIYQIALNDLERIIHSRRLRINAFLDAGVPPVFWNVLFAGAFLTIFMSYFVHFPSALAHASLVTIYCTALGFMFFLIAAIDNPYRGDIYVSIEPYQTLYESLKTERIEDVSE